MKLGPRFLAAIYVGFFVHTILVVVWGESGVIPMRELEAYRDKLVENVTNLQEINRNLGEDRDRLLNDPVEIELRARELGYRRSGEVRVTIPAVKKDIRRWTLGARMGGYTVDGERRNLFRAVAFVFAGLFFALTFVFYRKTRDHKT